MIPLTASMLPALTLPDDVDLAQHVHDSAMKLMPVVEAADDADQLYDILGRWGAYVRLIEGRRRKASGKAEAVARIVELRVAEVLDGQPHAAWPDGFGRNEIQRMRTMFKYRPIAEQAIADSTNADPASGYRVAEAIRKHRVSIGELRPSKGETDRIAADLERAQRQKAIQEQYHYMRSLDRL